MAKIPEPEEAFVLSNGDPAGQAATTTNGNAAAPPGSTRIPSIAELHIQRSGFIVDERS
jgi:hypothetical protein